VKDQVSQLYSTKPFWTHLIKKKKKKEAPSLLPGIELPVRNPSL
jgi:hypothetical protein